MREGRGIWSPRSCDRVAAFAAVVPLVVMAHAVDQVREEVDRLEDPGADLRVLHDLRVLVGLEAVRLGDHRIADADLPDVVEQPGDVDPLDQLLGEPELAGHLGRVDPHPLGVAEGVAVLGIHGLGQGADRLDVGHAQLLVLLRELLGAVPDLLLQVPVHVLELEVLLPGHLVQPLDLLLEIEVVEGLAEGRLELLVVPRLGDQAVDLAAVDGLHGDVHLRVAGEHHPDDVRAALADRLEQVDAAHLGHALVRDHHLGRRLLEHLESLRAAGCREHLPRLVAEQALKGLQDVALVVHEEHRVLRHRKSLRPAPGEAGFGEFLSSSVPSGGNRNSFVKSEGSSRAPERRRRPGSLLWDARAERRRKRTRSLQPRCRGRAVPRGCTAVPDPPFPLRKSGAASRRGLIRAVTSERSVPDSGRLGSRKSRIFGFFLPLLPPSCHIPCEQESRIGVRAVS